MAFDLRRGNFTFKHSRSFEEPDNETGSFREHFHSLYELLYFIGGEADYKIRHTRYRLRPHTLLVVKPGELHHVLIKSAEVPYERFVVRFDEADLPGGLRTLIRRLDNVYSIENTRLSEELFRLDAFPDTLPDEDAVFYAMRWQLHIILTYLSAARGLRRKADAVNEEVHRITDYIEQNLTGIHTIDDLSAGLHMSRSGLQKVFSTGFDMPVMRYVRTQKVTLAHAMLNDGYAPTEIPARCGFNDYSSFYRAYTKLYNMPPSGTNRR
ncbi:MAG: helix-turn-helix transcriptional regulator [Lachnospiraceae bacterium]|nr:helix-turn-helix transcriptional regulator [Lachnospiraceae bacterium]